jgi:hypothetical protein
VKSEGEIPICISKYLVSNFFVAKYLVDTKFVISNGEIWDSKRGDGEGSSKRGNLHSRREDGHSSSMVEQASGQRKVMGSIPTGTKLGGIRIFQKKSSEFSKLISII